MLSAPRQRARWRVWYDRWCEYVVSLIVLWLFLAVMLLLGAAWLLRRF